MKHIIILGGGITGLALGWFLKNQAKEAIHLTILEKSERVGGWIQTIKKNGFLFELGPHSIRTGKQAIQTLKFIERLGLKEKVITPDSVGKKRHILVNHKLKEIPSTLFSLLFSPQIKDLFFPLVKDLFTSPGTEEDESIYHFSLRHFGKEFTNRYVDALVTGIYAGNIRELSVKSCFPLWHQLDQLYGSLIHGMLFQKNPKEKETEFIAKINKSPFFSFQEGMESFPNEIAKQLGKDVNVNNHAAVLKFDKHSTEVFIAGGRRLRADHIFSTISADALADLLAPHNTTLGALLTSIDSASVIAVSLGYRNCTLKKQGFGYLVPSMERENILGMIWDSSIFPQQNNEENDVRVTVMLGGTKHPRMIGLRNEELIHYAIKAVSDHLQIHKQPDAVHLHRALHAIPQYHTGHSQKVEHLQKKMKNLFPFLTCLGSSFNGVSINECVMNAEIAAKHFWETS